VHGLFVTGTDTGVGKTALCAALCSAIASQGEPVRAYKPVLTGLSEPPAPWPRDDELLALAAGMAPAQVAPLRYGPAVSPHLAAELSGSAVEPQRLIAHARRLATDGAPLIVEGTGGLLVPLSRGYLMRDLAAALNLPVLIAARPGLGTISHTLMTLECARAGGLDVRAVVLTPWPDAPGELERCNRETIASLGDVEVDVLARVPVPRHPQLAAAGRRLPWRSWLDTPARADARARSGVRAAGDRGRVLGADERGEREVDHLRASIG
jgi:dethiobiotin synthetase